MELGALRLALFHSERLVEGKHRLILSNSIATKAYICKEGESKSQALMQEATSLLSWVEQYLESLSAEHVAGAPNT